ncbi:flagellin, partial [Anaerobiospirillum succiniciproducens]|uniref:flagellin n=1 Tax=Anaerobiospirillum succiniciproducens TaxID=13335 RepID=UPI002943F33E
GGGGGGQNAVAGGSGALTLQVGSNKGDTITFKVDSVYFSKIASDTNLVGADKFFKVDNKGQVSIDLTKITFNGAGGGQGANAKDIGDVINLMDQAIAKVDGMRADLGALQNRLESSIRNQSNVAANEADARSRIRDADFAEESANLSQQSIIQQAAASMLMQANTRPQLGLSLLG